MKTFGTTLLLTANEVLFSAGDESDSVFIIDEGALEVIHTADDGGELIVDTLTAGDVVGEITAVIGGRRTATVRAGDSPVTVRRVSAIDYGAWLASQPEEAERIAQQARERIDHTRVARVLTDLIGAGHRDIVDDTYDLLEWTYLRAGEQLFAQGDIADAVYIVVSGRLQLTATHAEQTTLDVAIGRGDIVGELGVIERAPRSASAHAARDTTLARLSIESFETLTAKHPSMMLQVFRKILGRIMRPNIRPPHAGMVAVAILDPAADPDLARQMAAEIGTHGPMLFLDRAQVGQFFQHRGIADAEVGTAENARLDEFLNEADAAHRWVLLETDRELTAWSRRALRSADRVLIVASAFPDERERHLVSQFAEVANAVSDRELWLVQSNAATIARPCLDHAFAASIRPDRVVQIHRGDRASVRRLARLASGNATGVALSGGGGRGLAHIGALRAVVEHGFAVDMVTGTSMGSIVAGAMALHVDPDEVLHDLIAGFRDATIVDYTLPVVSMTSGLGLTKAIDRMCGPALIEELRLSFACLSTNLTTAQKVVHRTGSLSRALRASVSLPGVFPPVVCDGDLLVDGGVLENLPVGPLAADPAIGHIIGIDVAPPKGPKASLDYGSGVKGSHALRNQMSRRRRSFPPLVGTVMAAMLLGSSQARNAALADDQIDTYLSLNLKGVKLLDFENVAEVAQRGYEATVAKLSATADASPSVGC